MPINATVPLGALADYAFILNVTPGEDVVDLTTVTSATFNVRRPDRSATKWTATMTNQTTTTLTLSHPYASGDISQLGFYQVYATLSTPSGPLLTTSVQLKSFDPYNG
jgi:hypothetical protein